MGQRWENRSESTRGPRFAHVLLQSVLFFCFHTVLKHDSMRLQQLSPPQWSRERRDVEYIETVLVGEACKLSPACAYKHRICRHHKCAAAKCIPVMEKSVLIMLETENQLIKCCVAFLWTGQAMQDFMRAQIIQKGHNFLLQCFLTAQAAQAGFGTAAVSICSGVCLHSEGFRVCNLCRRADFLLLLALWAAGNSKSG